MSNEKSDYEKQAEATEALYREDNRRQNALQAAAIVFGGSYGTTADQVVEMAKRMEKYLKTGE